MSKQPNDKGRSEETPSSAGTADEPKKPRIDWEDPNIPVGNAPPLPRWPLVVIGLVWVAWIVFMFVLVLSCSQAAVGTT